MIPTMSKSTWLLLLVILTPRVAHGQSAPTASSETPLAVAGDRTFTAAEVDARWKADVPMLHARALQMLYDGRRDALDALIAEHLLNRAAAAKGVPPGQFEEEEIARRTKPVTDQEVAAFFEENRAEMGGRPFDEMRAILREYLEEERKMAAREELFASLRAADASLRVLLDAPRTALPITADDPADGPAEAPVTVVVFADFECPFCRRLSPTLHELRGRYGDRVRLVWKDFPLKGVHPRAFQLAVAARCALDQGKFWEYHDRLFASPKVAQPSDLKQYASDVRLDVPRFSRCLESGTHDKTVESGVSLAARLGLSSTPTTFVNGRMVTGAKPYGVFAAVIDEELRRASGPR